MIKNFSKKNISDYHKNGFLVMDNFFSKKEISLIIKESYKVEKLSKTQKKKWMFYYEENTKKRLISRVENFLDFKKFLKKIFLGNKIMKLLSPLINSKIEIYKEKINFKYPNGLGFEPHQDMQAGWSKTNSRKYISMAVAIDKSNSKNGCIEVVAGKHKKGLLGKKFKKLPKKIVSSMKWKKIIQKPGDVIFFDGYTPHRSKKNYSNKKRRIIYTTYCSHYNGTLRKDYFAKKRLEFPPDIERVKNKKYSYKI